MYDEEALLPISALQHLLFCERQCALIHLEGVWLDNALTVEGTHLHRRTDTGPMESRGDLVIARAVPIRSLPLGITGRADVIEFLRSRPGQKEGVALPGKDGTWLPRPVEYKRGRPKTHRADEVQLCAQALCLEEMLGVDVRSGHLYYGASRRRTDVAFDTTLRQLTTDSIARLRSLLDGDISPPARFEPKCEACSLMPVCMPKVSGDVGSYVRREVHAGGDM